MAKEKNGYVAVVVKQIGDMNLDLALAKSLMDSWASTSNSANTYRGKIAVLKSIWYKQHGYTKESFADIEWEARNHIGVTRKNISRRDHLTDTDIEKLMKGNITARQKSIVMFLAWTGLRVTEARMINNKEIRETYTGSRITIVAEKTGLTIFRDVPKEIIDCIREAYPSRNWLFETGSGRPMLRGQIAEQIRVVGVKLLDKTISPHSFRHYWVRKQYELGVNPDHIARMLGHKNTGSHVESYLHY